MVFASFLKRKKERPANPAPELAHVFDKIKNMMQDEDLQNSMYPTIIRDKITGGTATDGISPEAEDFGRWLNNPIPVNGPIGELAYISRLKNNLTG